jgi:hypothetical protein
MSNLRILCYNGRLVTGTVVSLTTAKIRPLGFVILIRLGTDRTENTSNNAITAARNCRTGRVENSGSKLVSWWMLGFCCLATDIVYRVVT